MSKELYAQSSLHRMVRYDARSEIFDALGNLSGLRLRGNQLILAPYVQSGIMWSPDVGFPLVERLARERLYELYDSGKHFRNYKLAEESIWQGKVCLVVSIGEQVERTEVGRWVFTLQENTRGVGLQGVDPKSSRVLKEIGANYDKGWPCRFCYESDIYGDLNDPDAVT